MASKKKPPLHTVPRARQDVVAFVEHFAERQKQLLDAVVERAQKGDVHIDKSERGERYLDSVISQWCETQDPDLDLHMEMLGAVFYEALLDRLYELNPQEFDAATADTHSAARGHSVNDVLIEVLKTAQMFLGRK